MCRVIVAVILATTAAATVATTVACIPKSGQPAFGGNFVTFSVFKLKFSKLHRRKE